jgi:uncharacterized membrane protein
MGYLATVVPAFVLGTVMLVAPKGTPMHKRLGRVYLLLMLVTAAIALILPAQVGPTLLGHFGPIHLLCILVGFSVPRGWLAARRGDIDTHRRTMIRLYFLGLVLAGLFTLTPGRLIHGWLF